MIVYLVVEGGIWRGRGREREGSRGSRLGGGKGRGRPFRTGRATFFSRKNHAPGSQDQRDERRGREVGKREQIAVKEGRTRVGEGLGISPIFELERELWAEVPTSRGRDGAWIPAMTSPR